MLSKGSKKKIKAEIIKNTTFRAKKQPFNDFSAGSFFKNVPLNSFPKKFQKFFLDNNIGKNNFIPAGYLIEKVGLKSYKIGGVQVSLKHANFIVNLNSAKGKDVIQLKDIIIKKVENKFKVKLEPEVRLVDDRGEIL